MIENKAHQELQDFIMAKAVSAPFQEVLSLGKNGHIRARSII